MIDDGFCIAIAASLDESNVYTKWPGPAFSPSASSYHDSGPPYSFLPTSFDSPERLHAVANASWYVINETAISLPRQVHAALHPCQFPPPTLDAIMILFLQRSEVSCIQTVF